MFSEAMLACSPLFLECLNNQLLLSHSGLCSNPGAQNCYVLHMATKLINTERRALGNSQGEGLPQIRWSSSHACGSLYHTLHTAPRGRGRGSGSRKPQRKGCSIQKGGGWWGSLYSIGGCSAPRWGEWLPFLFPAPNSFMDPGKQRL